MTLLLSTVTVTPEAVGAVTFVKEDGVVKFRGSQSFIKKPIVFASGGSTCGLTVVVSAGGVGVSSGVFLQDDAVAVIKTTKATSTNKNFPLRIRFVLLISNSAHQFHTGTAVVIRAFPKACFVLLHH